ncbi:MAG: hypothetical protein AAFQ94_03470 [Bacteroidota bacterium]
MKTTHNFMVALLYMAFFLTSCDHEEVFEKTLTIDEVKSFYNQTNAANVNGRNEAIPISWEEGEYKDISLGDALLFPLHETQTQFVAIRGTETLQPLSYITYALAYRTQDDALHLDLIQRIPTEATEQFTGYITVNGIHGDEQYAYYYENGQLIQPESDGRSEDINCTWIDHQVCTSLTGGGDLYLGRCSTVSSYYYCLFNAVPSGLQPDDITGVTGGGGNGSDGTLCPHPAIPGAFVECGTCVWVDENGSCTTQNPYKLCANTLTFEQVDVGYTAEIVGLGATVHHSPSNVMLNVEFGNTCVTVGARNQYVAAELFAAAYNNARDELAIWVKTKSITDLNSTIVRAKLVALLNEWMQSLGYFTNGNCQGSIPISVAGYDTNC